MKNTNINAILADLADYTRLADELSAQIETLKDQVKEYMTEQDLTELLGENGSKVYWKEQVQTRFDSSSFKKSGYEELYKSFCRESIVRPFKFYK